MNPFYLPSAAKKIKELMYYLPLWTRIMHQSCKVNTDVRSSSTIESEFSRLKNLVFPKLPLRVDRFVVKHLQWLQGELKLVGSNIPRIENSKKKLKKSVDAENRFLAKSLSTLENWKGKNTGHSPTFEESNSSVTDSSRVTEDISHDQPSSVSFNTTKNSEEVSCVSNNLENVSAELPDSDSGSVGSNSANTDSKLDSSPLQMSSFLNGVPSNYSSFDGSNSCVEQQHNSIISMPLISIESDSNGSIDLMVNQKATVASHSSTFINFPKPAQQQTSDKTKLKTKSSKKSYLSAFPEWDMTTSVSSMNIPIMMNGNLSGSFVFKKTRVSVKNTCAFDSFFILFLQGMQASAELKNLVESLNDELGSFAVNLLKSGKIIREHYIKRFEILSKLLI